MTKKADVEAVETISRKLNVLISLSLRQLSGDSEFGAKSRKKNVGDAARYLSSMGLEPKDIAEILGAPISSIRTLLTPSRRR
jgi:hypothetical protein